MNKKAMMLSMYAGPFIFGLIVGVVLGIVLIAYLVNNGMFDLAMIPI